MKALLTVFMPLILKVIAFVISALIIAIYPKVMEWIRTKVSAAKLTYAETIAQKAYKNIITYVHTNPAAEKTLEALQAQFGSYMAKFMRLSPEQLTVLFNDILQNLITGLNINPSDFATAFVTAAAPAQPKKKRFSSKYLF